MTYEEAIEILKYDIAMMEFDPITGDSPVCYDETSKQLCEAEKLAIEVLERQIPKKPKLINSNFFGEKTPTCPICGDNWNSNEFGSGMECCWTCGQALDWSEEK